MVRGLRVQKLLYFSHFDKSSVKQTLMCILNITEPDLRVLPCNKIGQNVILKRWSSILASTEGKNINNKIEICFHPNKPQWKGKPLFNSKTLEQDQAHMLLMVRKGDRGGWGTVIKPYATFCEQQL